MRQAHLWTEQASAFVAAARVGHLATVRPDGSPHVVPICFAFDGETLFSVIDLKPKRAGPESLQRIRNITAHPAATLLIDHYAEDWSRLGFVMVTGRADVLRNGEVRDKAIGLLREKYPQYGEMDLDGRPVIRLVPERVASWGWLATTPTPLQDSSLRSG